VPASVAKTVTDARERAARDLLDAVRTELERTVDHDDPGRAVSTAMLHRQEAFAEAELAWLKSHSATLGKGSR
jgi:hypothetical protein